MRFHRDPLLSIRINPSSLKVKSVHDCVPGVISRGFSPIRGTETIRAIPRTASAGEILTV